jgi:pyruvate dehydrogenase E2 component (dihydrolipoamide acetyltransferase)
VTETQTPRPLTRVQKAVVRAMEVSATIPQFTLDAEVAVPPRGDGHSLSDAITGAAARALRLHPGVNASYVDGGILEHAQVNVGLAIATDAGLLMPAILDADTLGLSDLRAERTRLTEAARAGGLTPTELMSATFSISNLGPLGIRRFTALVVPPQAAILAVGAASPDGRMTVCLSCDHRVLDGAPAARFLGDLVAGLADPEVLPA